VRSLVAFVVAVAVSCSCQSEQRDFHPAAASAVEVQLGDLSAGSPPARAAVAGRYLGNAYAMSEGKRLYEMFNCVGCHARGGGGMGPALMDERWIYGAEPENIFATIVEGRPNGMPSFRGKVPPALVWQLVAYVRSLSGLAPSGAAPGRSDSMSVRPLENRTPARPTTRQEAQHL
jgi:cytochrome c oxidase cbb3-type subunit 3